MTASESEQQRIEALAERDSGGDPDWRACSAPGTFGCHEALHVSSLLMDLVATQLLEHEAVVQNSDWYRLADEAHTALFNLYQAIGAVHLQGGTSA